MHAVPHFHPRCTAVIDYKVKLSASVAVPDVSVCQISFQVNERLAAPVVHEKFGVVTYAALVELVADFPCLRSGDSADEITWSWFVCRRAEYIYCRDSRP